MSEDGFTASGVLCMIPYGGGFTKGLFTMHHIDLTSLVGVDLRKSGFFTGRKKEARLTELSALYYPKG
ncbi:MAG: hypothetical protein EOP49_17745 [Sphingobacteriales bacterium]|nr:MAG: hypothetical protein EOP49_17745 [Sphingobacteriales bacterium]